MEKYEDDETIEITHSVHIQKQKIAWSDENKMKNFRLFALYDNKL